MSRTITFVTESHAWEDEKSSAEVLDRSDVRAIASDLANAAERDAVEVSKREINRHARRVQALEGSLEQLRKDIALAQACTEYLKGSVEKIVENARAAFSSSVEEILRPQYETLASILAAATAPTSPENEFHAKVLQALSDVGRALQHAVAAVDGRLNSFSADVAAIREANARNGQAVSQLTNLCQTILAEIRNQPKKKSFFQWLFSRNK